MYLTRINVQKFKVDQQFVQYKSELDFTFVTYKKVLDVLWKEGFTFQSLQDFLIMPVMKVIIFHHDVDRLPENSLEFARIEADYG